MSKRSAVDPISALRHRGFLIYLIGGLISNSGSQMRIVAAQWEVVLREPGVAKQALFLGYIGLALVLPVILFALPAGAG
jgi:F0F1-type ATP synthase membrane subunit c/vacuolar-type H+-ATPase subunit K